MNFAPVLEHHPVHVSVPCRVDFGGTLDISTFYLSLGKIKPATLNLALDMRTHVILEPWEKGRVKISSRGFEPYESRKDELSFDHSLGLMAAVLTHFDAHGIHARIESTSPPRSALGGSSSAAVALIAALFRARNEDKSPAHIAWLAHYIEAAVAGIPCGTQDQTAAAFGGVNLWEWSFGETGPAFRQIPVYDDPERVEQLNNHILVAYCGIPHESRDVNSKWVRGFIRGQNRGVFKESADLTREFTRALSEQSFTRATELMNRETRIRLGLTPEVLDDTGIKLFENALDASCGARFTGAGGGGCIWAVGEQENIKALACAWEEVLAPLEGAKILDTRIDTRGILLDASGQ